MNHLLAALPEAATAYAGSFVEFLEALSVVLAVGVARGWRQAALGAVAAVAVLAGLLLAAGPLVGPPPWWLRLLVGVLSLQFGLRWLQKAVLRGAGRVPLRDEAAAFARARAGLVAGRGRGGWDGEAVLAAFQVVLIEGIEAAFIVVAAGSAGGRMGPAVAGGVAALLSVAGLGVVLHRPITRVPENSLKFGVGVMMAAFGCAWIDEGLGASFPGGVLGLAVFWAVLAFGVQNRLARGQAEPAGGVGA